MDPPAWALDVDDDGMMHQAINDAGRDHMVSEVIAEILEIDIRCKKRGTLAITAINDLEKEGGIFSILLFKPVKAYFVNEENVG